MYDGFFGSERYRPRYVRAALENAGLLAFEFVLYWWQPASNTIDWQFPDLGAKLTSGESVRFDDNMERTNWTLHPVAGGMHYGFTRANGFGIPASFFAAALSSTLYEAVFEWREVVSINDLIVTPFAGMALGEFLFHLGDYLNSEPVRPRMLDEVVGLGPLGRDVAGGTFGFVRRTHDPGDEPRLPLLADDSLGYSSAYAHRFRLLAGYDMVANDQGKTGSLAVVSAGAELAAMPGFLRPGRISTWFSNGNFTSMDVRVAFDSDLRDVDLLVDSHLFGHFAQSFDAVAGGMSGSAHELAVHTALHYVDRWLLGRRDTYPMLHLLGPVGTFWIGHGPTMVRLSADVSPDFAAPRSLAYESWSNRFGMQGTKTSLQSHSYYFAWGVSAGASTTVSFHGLTLGARGRYGHYESIDGAERAVEEVTREPHNTDDILELAGTLGYEPPRSVFSVGVTAAHFARLSNMAPVTTVRSDQRVGVAVGLAF